MGLQATLRGWVSRQQPQAIPDTQFTNQRFARYGEGYVVPILRKQAALADEGSYFVANNAGAGVATAAAPTAYSDTAPLLTIYNTDSPTNLDAKRIHLDFLRVVETAAGTAGTGLNLQVKLDNIQRYASGGTALTPTNPNMDVARSLSVGQFYLLPTAAAASATARTVVGTATGLVGATAPLAANSSLFANFGGVEGALTHYVAATIAVGSIALPPIVVGPGQSCVISFLITAQSATSSWTAELGWWER